jgi:hypothetical protein
MIKDIGRISLEDIDNMGRRRNFGLAKTVEVTTIAVAGRLLRGFPDLHLQVRHADPRLLELVELMRRPWSTKPDMIASKSH